MYVELPQAVALLLAELLLSCCGGSELVQLLHKQLPVVVTNTYMRWLCDKYIFMCVTGGMGQGFDYGDTYTTVRSLELALTGWVPGWGLS